MRRFEAVLILVVAVLVGLSVLFVENLRVRQGERIPFLRGEFVRVINPELISKNFDNATLREFMFEHSPIFRNVCAIQPDPGSTLTVVKVKLSNVVVHYGTEKATRNSTDCPNGAAFIMPKQRLRDLKNGKYYKTKETLELEEQIKKETSQ